MPISAYSILAFLIFSIGVFGVITRRNMIGILLSLELMLNSVNLNLVALSRAHGHANGQVFAFFAIAITVAEVAVGLSIAILMFRIKKVVDADKFDLMKW